MLHLPGSSPIVTIVGIDPGTSTLGVAILFVNIETQKIELSIAWTLNGNKLSGKDSWTEEMHGGRYSRIAALEENLLQIFNYYQPLIIVSESPFINNRFPQAGIALTEVVVAIRRAVVTYDPWRELHVIDPPTIKKAVNAAGNATKEVMKEKVMELTDLNYNGMIPLVQLDEHSIDALSVAYCKWKTFLEELCLIK